MWVVSVFRSVIKVCCRRNYSSLRARLRTRGCWVTGGQSEARLLAGWPMRGQDCVSWDDTMYTGAASCYLCPLAWAWHGSIQQAASPVDTIPASGWSASLCAGLSLVISVTQHHLEDSEDTRGPGTWTVTRGWGWAAEAELGSLGHLVSSEARSLVIRWSAVISPSNYCSLQTGSNYHKTKSASGHNQVNCM